MTILAGDLTAAVDELAPADCPLMLHVSLRSLGVPIARGADTLLDALLTRGRTVLVPTFTEPQFGLPAPRSPAARAKRCRLWQVPRGSTFAGWHRLHSRLRAHQRQSRRVPGDPDQARRCRTRRPSAQLVRRCGAAGRGTDRSTESRGRVRPDPNWPRVRAGFFLSE